MPFSFKKALSFLSLISLVLLGGCQKEAEPIDLSGDFSEAFPKKEGKGERAPFAFSLSNGLAPDFPSRSSGSPLNVLVIPWAYDGYGETGNFDYASLDEKLNGAEGKYGVYSSCAYALKFLSGGALSVHFVLAPPYDASTKITQYRQKGTYQSICDFLTNEGRSYLAAYPKSLFDSNEDGLYDSVIILDLAPRNIDDGSLFWGCAYALPSSLCPSVKFLLTANVCKMEDTIPHEIGHAMGLNDLYGRSGDNYSYPAGGISLMESTRGPLTAEEEWLLGWDTPMLADPHRQGQSFELTSSDDALFFPKGESDDPFGEFLVFQYLNPGESYVFPGEDSFGPFDSKEILIYHVDGRLFSYGGDGTSFVHYSRDGAFRCAFSNQAVSGKPSPHPFISIIASRKPYDFFLSDWGAFRPPLWGWRLAYEEGSAFNEDQDYRWYSDDQKTEERGDKITAAFAFSKTANGIRISF